MAKHVWKIWMRCAWCKTELSARERMLQHGRFYHPLCAFIARERVWRRVSEERKGGQTT